MGQNKHEYPLLYPLIPLLLLVPLMKFVFSMDSFEAAFLIVVVPLLTFCWSNIQ